MHHEIKNTTKKTQDVWATRILHETRIGQYASPKSSAAGLLSSQMFTDSRGVNTTLPERFWDIVLPSNSKWYNIFLDTLNFLSLNLWYFSPFMCVFDICKSLFLFTFYTVSFFRNCGCRNWVTFYWMLNISECICQWRKTHMHHSNMKKKKVDLNHIWKHMFIN